MAISTSTCFNPRARTGRDGRRFQVSTKNKIARCMREDHNSVLSNRDGKYRGATNEMKLQAYRGTRICRYYGGHLRFAESSYLEETFGIIRHIGANVFYPTLPVVPQKVKTQTVVGGIDFLFESSAKQDKLSRIERAFENRFLHTLSKVLTSPGNTAQPTLSEVVLSRNVVRD
jgi:hypothetical protein